MPQRNTVQNVLTVKTGDTRPTLVMSIDDMNTADAQPFGDTAVDDYDAEIFESAERVELHMDRYDADSESFVRVVDGRQASWDGSADEVSIQLTRDDTAWVGEYTFEWVCIYDADATNYQDADEVNTVPNVGYFKMEVGEPTNRDLDAPSAPNRVVGTLTIDDGITLASDTAGINASGGDISNVGAFDADSATVSSAPTAATDVARGGEAIPRGPVADRPASGSYDDELYYATDQQVLWGWDADASDWTIRGGTGSLSQQLTPVHTETVRNDATIWNQTNSIERRGQSGLPRRLNWHRRQTPGDRAPVLTFTFDDGWMDNFNNRSVFANNDAYISMAVNPARLDPDFSNDSYMDWSHLDQMMRQEGLGEALNHTLTHSTSRLDRDQGATIDELYEEFHDSHRLLLEHGYNPETVVWARDTQNDPVSFRIATEVYPYGQDSNGGWTGQSDPIGELLQDTDQHRIMRFPIDGGASMADIEGLIDDAVAADHGITLAAHHIVDGTIADEGQLEVSTERLNQTITYAKNAGMRMGTFSDYIESEITPRSFPGLNTRADARVEIDSPIISGSQYYATSDDELDDAVIESGTGDTIHLANEDFTADRTVPRVHIKGANGTALEQDGSRINGANWTANGSVTVEGCYIRNSTITLDFTRSSVRNCGINSGSEIIVNDDNVLIDGIVSVGGTITFASGTSGGVVGAVAGNVTITDNGTNDTP